MSRHILTIRGQPSEPTHWFLTGIDNDQWDDISFTDACYQGSLLRSDLDELPRRVAPIQTQQGHYRGRPPE